MCSFYYPTTLLFPERKERHRLMKHLSCARVDHASVIWLKKEKRDLTYYPFHHPLSRRGVDMKCLLYLQSWLREKKKKKELTFDRYLSFSILGRYSSVFEFSFTFGHVQQTTSGFSIPRIDKHGTYTNASSHTSFSKYSHSSEQIVKPW